MSRCVAARVPFLAVLALMAGAAGIALGVAWAWTFFYLADLPGATDEWREGTVLIGETLGQIISIMGGLFGPALVVGLSYDYIVEGCTDA